MIGVARQNAGKENGRASLLYGGAPVDGTGVRSPARSGHLLNDNVCTLRVHHCLNRRSGYQVASERAWAYLGY